MGCLLVVADAEGDCGLVGWTPELHLLGTTGCGPLCTGRGYMPPDGKLAEFGYPDGGVVVYVELVELNEMVLAAWCPT